MHDDDVDYESDDYILADSDSNVRDDDVIFYYISYMIVFL